MIFGGLVLIAWSGGKIQDFVRHYWTRKYSLFFNLNCLFKFNKKYWILAILSIMLLVSGIFTIPDDVMETEPMTEEGKIELLDVVMTLKQETVLRETHISNSQIVAELGKGDLVIQLYGPEALITHFQGDYYGDKDSIPVMYFGFNRESKKGWIEKEYLDDSIERDWRKALLKMAELFFSFEFLRTGLIGGTIGFAVTMIISAFNYKIREKLNTFFLAFSTFATMSIYVLFQPFGGLLLWWIIVIPIIYGNWVTRILFWAFDKIYYHFKGYSYRVE